MVKLIYNNIILNLYSKIVNCNSKTKKTSLIPISKLIPILLIIVVQIIVAEELSNNVYKVCKNLLEI